MMDTGFLLLYRGVNFDPPIMLRAESEAACAGDMGVELCGDTSCRNHNSRLGPHTHIPFCKFPREASEYPLMDPGKAGHHYREYAALGGEVVIVDHFSPPSRRRPVTVYFKRGQVISAAESQGVMP